MSLQTFDFEKPILDLEEELRKLRVQYERAAAKKKAADDKARAAEAKARAAAEAKAEAEREAAEAKAEVERAKRVEEESAGAADGGEASPVESPPQVEGETSASEPPSEASGEPLDGLDASVADDAGEVPGPEISDPASEVAAPAPSASAESPATDAAPGISEIHPFVGPEPVAFAAPEPPLDADVASDPVDPKLAARIREVEAALVETRIEVYANLGVWQRVQLARHPARPHATDYIHRIFTDFVELRGDRAFGDDAAVVAGVGRFQNRPVAVVGQQKGADLKDNLRRNFGMMHPEGYRKALRTMKLAEKFAMPVVVLIDTPGAYPGIGAEERGQGEAIGRNILEMATLRVPVVCVVIGEGASGGALGVGVGDRLLMMKYAWYCVISPEGCASILWRDPAMAPKAAEALRLTSDDLLRLGVIDEIVPEPLGGAHRDPVMAADYLRDALARHLDELLEPSPDELIERRYEKYRTMGEAYLATAAPAPAATE